MKKLLRPLILLLPHCLRLRQSRRQLNFDRPLSLRHLNLLHLPLLLLFVKKINKF